MELLGTAGLLVAGAITPGPNNFVVMREAARVGWRGALPAIAGVVSGSVTLLLLVAFGVGSLIATSPRLALAIAMAGCLYLVGLGGHLLAPRSSKPRAETLPAGAWGLFAFQFLNPKSWLLVLTVTASAQAELGPLVAIPSLVALFVLVPSACLGLWSWVGMKGGRIVDGAWLDRAMGLLLIASALLLLIGTWR